jgi:hypothetical protein
MGRTDEFKPQRKGKKKSNRDDMTTKQQSNDAYARAIVEICEVVLELEETMLGLVELNDVIYVRQNMRPLGNQCGAHGLWSVQHSVQAIQPEWSVFARRRTPLLALEDRSVSFKRMLCYQYN